MIRPFKNIEEFQTKTAIFVGDVLPIRVKQDISYKEPCLDNCLVTELNYSNKTVGIGTHVFSLEALCENFEFQKDNKWLPFGVEETSTRPAKFKVGKEYFYRNKEGFDKKIYINAKYKDPADGLIKVVFTNGEISVCYLDKDGNEYITFCDYEINAKNVVKYEVNAKNEVKE